MKETDIIEGYEEAVKNIDGLYYLRESRGITQKELSQLSGISVTNIQRYETHKCLPEVKNYNKLAKFFGWKIITLTQSEVPSPKRSYKKLEDLPPFEPVKLPEVVKFTFLEGHNYTISKIVYTEKYRGGQNSKHVDTLWSDDCVFRYEGKQGIHHIFREVRGNWTRTYTDAQLIGKRISEVI